MTFNELKAYFDTAVLPETYDWKPWAKITNCKNFVSANLLEIEGWKTYNLSRCPAYQHLLDFYECLQRPTVATV